MTEKKEMFEQVKKNKHGFYTLKKIPTADELQGYYSKKYYQNENSSYQKKYSYEEITYINNKIEQRYEVVVKQSSLNEKEHYRFLDIGCGEGWALKYFKQKSWDVTGLDYSEFGCKQQNPECVQYLIAGDIYESIETLVSENNKYNVIWLDNVLEHVINPQELLIDCQKLLADKGTLVVEVPNDFSKLQQYLFNSDCISTPFWVVAPDHISYFNKEGLISLAEDANLKCNYVMSDFPIDFNLFNDSTNYVENKGVGRACHESRIAIENFMHNINHKQTNKLYEALADLGLGRSIIAFFQKKGVDA
ncbi:MAG: class I SAM-dependent methyltransferase [Alkaliphilus sp.]